jgi:predicted ABC-type transport system involved in lysophospholipase L1 biosynthesis ATPase subunit
VREIYLAEYDQWCNKPTSGEVYVCGGALHKMNETECSKWRGKYIGVIYQSFQLLASLR